MGTRTQADQWIALCLYVHMFEHMLVRITGMTLAEIDELNYRRIIDAGEG
jgi:hypothetical protein